jgi:hypothetical protein
MSPEERLKQIRGQKPKPVTAKSIVDKHRRTIIDLARNSCATQDEIITVLKEMGEVIPEDGLKAAIRSEIGTMKDIKAGRIKAENLGPMAPVTPTPAVSVNPTEEAYEAGDDFRVPRPPHQA